MEEYRFKVNLQGMIELLSDHLYSSPDVYIRELLQNGVDAIVGREKSEEEYKEKKQGVLQIRLNERESLSFRDNGVGLTKEEIHRFLAIIGESSKRDLESGKILSDYIGRFGIGLLSCFMVADDICIRTHSIKEQKSYEWIGHPDGMYEIRELEKDIPVGTEIFLKAKSGCGEYFEAEKVERLLLHYGMILPYPILLDNGTEKKRINPAKLPWEGEEVDKMELLIFGQMIFQTPFMDCIVLHSEEGGVDGVAYILPYAVQASTKQKNLIYLKNMLLTEKGENILPSWAVFTKCIINSQNLRPTASREGFYEDESLLKAQREIGNCIADYIKNLARENKDQFRKFLEVHSLVVRSMAIEDDELFELFIDELEFSTTRGMLTGFELRMSKEQLLYSYLGEYQHLSQLFLAQGRLLINAGYVYTEGLLYKMADYFHLEVTHVDSCEVDDLLRDVDLQVAEKSVDFLNTAEEVLSMFHCDVEIKQFMPANLPAFYYLDENAKICQEVKKTKEESSDLFAGMLGNFAEEFEQKQEAVLYFNYHNPIVKKMIQSNEKQTIKRIIMILYVQTLLIGGFTLYNNELGIMNDSLLSILEDGNY